MTRDNDDIGHMPLHELLEAIASNALSPGAGAAGAIALALAAACAGKAASISLKKDPGAHPLAQARDRLAAIARIALNGADEDAARFRDFVTSGSAESQLAGELLVESGERLQRLSAELTSVLAAMHHSIDPVMSGDLLAAQALSSAFDAIEAANLRETREKLPGQTR